MIDDRGWAYTDEVIHLSSYRHPDEDEGELVETEQVYSVPVSESQMRALEEHGQYLLKIGATRLGLKFLTLALNWRTAREAQR